MTRYANWDAEAGRVTIDRGTVATGGGSIIGRDQKNYSGQYIENAYFGFIDRQPEPPVAAGQSPPLLFYLTDRTEQLRHLTKVLQSQFDAGLNKPTTFFAVGSDDECLDSFVRQVRYVGLPGFLKANGLPANVMGGNLKWPGATGNSKAFNPNYDDQVEQVKEEICTKLGIKTTAHSLMLAQQVANGPASCLFDIGINLAHWRQEQVRLLQAWLKWFDRLDFSKSRNRFVFVVTVIYPGGIIYRLRSQGTLIALQQDLDAIAAGADPRGAVHALPRLGSIRYDDVEQWIKDYVKDDDHETLRKILRKRFSSMFGFADKAMTMYRAAKIVERAWKDGSIRTSRQPSVSMSA